LRYYHRKPEEVFEKVARADENIVKLADARDQRDGSRPPPYTKTAVEQLVDFYLHRAMWLKRWREEVER
jgi:hypothetical protein